MSPTHHIAAAAAGFLTELEGEGFAGKVHRSRAARLVQTTDNGIYQVWSLPLSFLSAHGERSLAQCGLVTPPSAWRRIARIWGSLYFVIFIQNRLMHIAKKILLMKPLTSGGITPSNTRFDNNSHPLSRLSTFHVDVAAAILAPSAPVKTD
jgi:hypothetical protein